MTGWTEEQFELLVREHHQAVYRSALRIVGDVAAAADVAQDVFARAAAGKVRLAESTSERATLCWLAARLGQNAVRARLRRKGHEHKHHEEIVMSAQHSYQDPAAVAESHDMTELVQQCVAELPSDLQRPLEMHYQDELTLSAVGSALRLSTSTVYDRVQRALTQLRTALKGRGLAVAPAALPQLLRDVPVPAVPTGLEAQLLLLAKTSTLVVVDGSRRLAIAAFAALCVSAVAIGTHLHSDNARFDSATPATATLAASGASDREPFHTIMDAESGDDMERMAVVTELPQQDPQPRKLKVRGTVHDSAHWPVVGATVTVVAAGGLKAFKLGGGTTDHRGGFDFRFDRALRPTAVRLAVHEAGVRLLLTDELQLPRKDPEGAFELQLPEQVGIATERYECAVSVQDDAGAALPGVKVTVYSGPLPMHGMVRGRREALGETDDRGTVQLRGRKLGAKWFFVDGRHLGYGYSFSQLHLGKAGQHSEVFQLTLAGSLHVLSQSVDGKAIGRPQVWLFDEQRGVQMHGKEDPKGGVRFTGLKKRRYSLQVNAGREYSPGRILNVSASEEPVMVTLKSRLDVRDVGNHMGEVHGTVVDAETGEEVSLASWAIEVLKVRSCQSTSPFDGVVPPAPVQRMAGRFRKTGFHEVGLKPGCYAIVVGERGYARATHEFEITDRDLHAGIRIALHRGATVSGRVLDAGGKPVKGASVVPVGVGAGADALIASWRSDHDYRKSGTPNDPPCVAISNENGEFRLTGVPPGFALRLVARRLGKVAVAPLGILKSGGKTNLPPLHL